jgi:hypothetical protein
MTFSSRYSNESLGAAICIGCGVGASVVLSPKDEYFLGNFAYYWLPQAAIIVVLCLTKARPAIVAACALVLAIYLVAFDTWVATLPARDGALAWVGYLFALPGAAVGAIASVLIPVPNALRGAASMAMVTALLTITGLSASQAILCTTVMHCSF